MDNDSLNNGARPPAMLETALGPESAGLPQVPEPSTWDSAYGIDDAVAIAVVPERVLVIWELASIIAAGQAETSSFRLIRLHLTGDFPQRESSWSIGPVGRFQDSGLCPGEQYLYVIARVIDGEELPIMVTNPIRMPLRHVPGESLPLPSSAELTKIAIEKVLKGRKDV